ncbi:hypothetical protein ACA910_003137 [Epithemia clementina (nom. ined.)]
MLPSSSSSTSSPSSDQQRTVLVTGGCGYIGSHTLVCLLEQGYKVVVVDNLSNSSVTSLERVRKIVGLPPQQPSAEQASADDCLVFYELDICEEVKLRQVFVEQSNKQNGRPFFSCIHFAGLKAVGESTKIPLRYYENNLGGTFTLLKLLDEYGCHSIVFSSSATVYGAAKEMPITEQAIVGLGITNAYGRTKYMVEEILKDFYNSMTLEGKATDWSVVLLRYFNPIGAHPSGLIGEDPNGIPNNLMPYVAQVAVGRRPKLTVFGNDYAESHDGTGVRDYLHVMDLSEGHLSAIHYMDEKKSGLFTFNLGTGKGYSVLDMIHAMREASGTEIPYEIGPRRPGDIAICYADAEAAATEMGWRAKRNLKDMCKDLWNWQSQNPNGYAGATN